MCTANRAHVQVSQRSHGDLSPLVVSTGLLLVLWTCSVRRRSISAHVATAVVVTPARYLAMQDTHAAPTHHNEKRSSNQPPLMHRSVQHNAHRIKVTGGQAALVGLAARTGGRGRTGLCYLQQHTDCRVLVSPHRQNKESAQRISGPACFYPAQNAVHGARRSAHL